MNFEWVMKELLFWVRYGNYIYTTSAQITQWVEIKLKINFYGLPRISNHTCCYFVCGQHGSWLIRRMVITCPTAWNFRRKLFVPTWRLCVGIDGSGTTSRCIVYHKVILLPTFYHFPASSWARGRRLASDYFVLMFQGPVTDTINYCFSKRKKGDLAENFILN